jgi:MFS family permease
MSDAAPRSFPALRHPGFRMFFICQALAMSADVIEHVISYFVLFHTFHSPALQGFAVIAHWLPFLTLSVYSGGLAERFDVRRIIQVGMGMFAGVSLAWGWVFLSGHAQMWHAIVLLIIHGLAGVLWNPAAQLLLYDIVGPNELQSAVRLSATARYLGLLVGPGVGALMLAVLGPVRGIFLNALIYLPMILWLARAPYGPKFRAVDVLPPRVVRGFQEVFATLRLIRDNPILLSMTLLAAAASGFIGNAYQAQMPEFAVDLGHGDPGVDYYAIIAADALGALTAGIVLESRALLVARPRTAFILALLWCLALAGFALFHSFGVVLALLVVAGFVELSFNSMAQALVQIHAPVDARARVIGVFLTASLGMRMFGGITVGLLGSLIGVHWSLALSAAALFVVVLVLLERFAIRPATPAA